MSADSEPISSEDIQNLLASCDSKVKEMTDNLKAVLDLIMKERASYDDSLFRVILLDGLCLGSVKRYYAGLSMWRHSYDTVTSNIRSGMDYKGRFLSFLKSWACCRELDRGTIDY